MFNAFFDSLGDLFVRDRVVGSSGVPTDLRTPDVFKKISAVAITAGTPVSVWTPAAGKKFRLMGWSLMTSAGTAVLFEDATGVEFIRAGVAAVNTASISPPLGNGYLSAAANNSLFLDVTATATLNGFVFGTEE